MPVGGGSCSCKPVKASLIAASSAGSPVDPATWAREMRPAGSGQTRTFTFMLALRVLRFCCKSPTNTGRTWPAYQPHLLPPLPPPNLPLPDPPPRPKRSAEPPKDEPPIGTGIKGGWS